MKLCKSRDDSVAIAPRWLSSLDPVRYIPINREEHSSVKCVLFIRLRHAGLTPFSVRHRSHSINISLAHQAPAYLNEDYPLTIQVTNIDDKELEVILDVLLLPTEVDNASRLSSTSGELFAHGNSQSTR